jgi:hypothetical protein
VQFSLLSYFDQLLLLFANYSLPLIPATKSRYFFSLLNTFSSTIKIFFMRKKFLYAGLLFASLSLFNFSCQKESTQFSEQETGITSQKNDNEHGHLKQTKTYSSDVVKQWVKMHLDMLRLPLAPGTGGASGDRLMAYCGIAVYESVVNGMPAYQSLSGQLTDFPVMPETEPGKAYHWAACANAALAEMSRKLFPTTSDANKTSMNNLENQLQSDYATEVDALTIQRSIAFGKEVATRILAWAATDGSTNVNPPYIPPVGPGLWVPTAPSPAANPYAIQRRLLVPGVQAGTALEPPPTYSANPASPFFAMAKDVHDKSLALTQAQKDLALYYKDAPGQPGFPGFGHFVALFSQVLEKASPELDIAALAYVKAGIGLHEAGVICFIYKYNFNLIRPITYIRNEMGFITWEPFFSTPNHPEFPSAHSSNAGGCLTMLSNVFGENFQLIENTYEYMGLANRTYHSFSELKKAIGDSRVYGGIHYQATCDKSTLMGEKVAANILRIVKFRK